jgi:hypothetical protein
MFYSKYHFINELIDDVYWRANLFEDVWFKDVLHKDVWFKDVVCKDVIFKKYSWCIIWLSVICELFDDVKLMC